MTTKIRVINYPELGVGQIVSDIDFGWFTAYFPDVDRHESLHLHNVKILSPDGHDKPQDKVDVTSVDDKPTRTIKCDGGPAGYYDFPPNWITLNDYIEDKSLYQWGADSFHLANITKAGCRWGDKAGTTRSYDARKIAYSALRILRRLDGKDAVRDYLQELLDDKQFQP